MAIAGLSFANPFMDKVGIGEAPNPYAPFSPTSSIGAGGLGPSAADMAVAGDTLVKQSQFTMPEMTRPATVAFSPSRNEFFVQGTTFSASDAPAALQAEQLLGRPGVELPAGGDWVPLDATAYQQYLGSIRSPSLGRLASKNFGRGVDAMQALAGRGLQLAGAEELGGRIVKQQEEDLQRTAPYERRFTDIDSGRGAVEWLVANFAQQGPNLIESVAVALAGAAAGTAAAGPLGGAVGTLAGIFGKKEFKDKLAAAAQKVASGQAKPGSEEYQLLRNTAAVAGAAAAGYTSNIATGAADIYGELRDQGADAADVDARLKALAGSVPYALMETLPEYLLASRLFSGTMGRAALPAGATVRQRAGELLRRGAIGGAVGGTLEGTTEAGQEALLLGISGQDMSSPEAVDRLINSFAAGFGVGGPIGAVANLRGKQPENLLNPAQNAEPQPGTALALIPPTQPSGPGTSLVPAQPQGSFSISEVTPAPRALAGPAGLALPPQLTGPTAPLQLAGPVNPLVPVGPPSIMVTPGGVAYPDQMFSQQANVPPGAVGTQGLLNVFAGNISAQELASRMQPGMAPTVETILSGIPEFNPAQGALQFAGAAPTSPANTQLANQLQARQDRLRREREFDQAQQQRDQQEAAQREAELGQMVNQRQLDLAAQPLSWPAKPVDAKTVADLELMQQGEAPAPAPMPMRPAGPTQPVQLPLFTRRQAPVPSRAEGLRRGVGTQIPEPTGTTPLTAAEKRKQGKLFTTPSSPKETAQPTLAALKSAGKRRTLPRIAAKPRATTTVGARGVRKGARVAEVNVTETPSATQEGKLKQGRVAERQQDNAGVQGGGDAGNKPASKVQAGGAQAGGGGKSLKRGKKPTEALKKEPPAPKVVAAPAADRDYAEQVLATYNALPEDQRDAVASELGLTRAQVIESEAVFERTEEVDDAIAAVKRRAKAAPEPTVVAEPTEADLSDAAQLEEDIAIAAETADIREFQGAIKPVLDYAYFAGEDTNIRKLVDSARAFLAGTQFTEAQAAVMDSLFVEGANNTPRLEAKYKGGANSGNPKPWFDYAVSRKLLDSITTKVTNLPEEYRAPAPKAKKESSADKMSRTPEALLGRLIDQLATRLREQTSLTTKVRFDKESYANIVVYAKQLYAQTSKAGRDYIVRGVPLKDYFRADGSPKMLKSSGRYLFTSENLTAEQQRQLEVDQRAEAKALAEEARRIAVEEAERREFAATADIVGASRPTTVGVRTKGSKSYAVEDAWDDDAVDLNVRRDSTGGMYYRDDGTPLTGTIPPGRVRLLVKNFLAKLRMKPNTFVYANVADLKARNPDLYRRAAAARKEGDFDTTNAVGYSFGPNVIIFSDFVRTEQQLKFVLAHETLGHFGFKGVVPQRDLARVLERIYELDSNVQAGVDAMMANRGMSKLEAIEEYLADNAAELDTSTIARIWNALKNFLNKLGFSFEDDAARYFVNLARKYVRRGDGGNFASVRSMVADMQALDQQMNDGRYARINAGDMGARVMGAGAYNRSRSYSGSGGLLGAMDAFVKDVFGKRRDVPGTVARLLEQVQTLDNKARRSYGLNQLYRLLEKQQQFSRSLLSKYQRMTEFTHSATVFGFGEGVTEDQKEVAGELLARAALLRSEQATDALIKSFKSLVSMDAAGNIVVDEAVRREIEKAGRVTAEEFRKGFDITYTDGSKARFQYDVKEDSPEWKVYTELRDTVNEAAIDLMLANYEAAQSEASRVIGDLNQGRTATNVFSREDLATIRKVAELYQAKRYAGSDVASAAVEVKKAAAENSEEFLIAFGRAIFDDNVYAVWMKDPKAKAEIVKDLEEFQKAEYDDFRDALASIRAKVKGSEEAKKQQSYVVQKAVRDLFLFDLQSKNADYYAKRTILGSYVPFSRRGTEQVRLMAVNSKGNPVALDESIRAALPYFQFDSRSEAMDAAAELDKTFGGDNEFVLKDEDGNEVTVRLVAEVSRTRQSPDLTEAVNFNEFVYVLNRLNINLTPEARERIVTTLTSQNDRARKNLQRSGTEGWDKDVVRSVSEHLETGAHVAAKKLYRHRLDDLMLNKAYWQGDAERLQLLKDAVTGAQTDGARARAQRAYDEYAYMYRYMAGSTGERTVTIDGKEVPTLGRGEDYLEEAKKVLRWYSDTSNISDSTEDMLSGETGSTLKLFTVLMQLGGSLATAVVNLASLATHSLPYLSYYNSSRGFGGGYGEAKASAALFRAATDVKNFRLSDDAFLENMLRDGTHARYGLTKDEAQFLFDQTEQGTLQAAQFNALVGTARGKVFNNKAQAAVRAWMSAFSYTEQLNRRVTALAAYRLERERLQAQGITDEKQLFDDATEAARTAVNASQGEYAMFNRPEMARGNVLQYIFMYKQFVITTVQLMKALPPKGQLLMLGLLLLSSGLKGLPFAEDIFDVVDTIAQKLGLKMASVEKELAEFIDAVAPGMTPYLMRGIMDRATGATVSTRLGMGDLVPLTGAFRAGADPAREAADFAGPVFSGLSGLVGMVGNLAKYGAETIGLRDDTTSLAGILRDSPVAAARAIADGLAYMDSGMITNARGQVVSKEAPYHVIAARFLGFYPAIATEQNDIVRLSKYVAEYAKSIKAEYVGAYVKAKLGNDGEAMRNISADVGEWNDAAEGTGLEIRRFLQSANRAALEASRPTALRYLKSAPTQMRPETRELLRINGLEDEIR